MVVHDPIWIPLSDGCRLAARVWLPEDAGSRPGPAILEAIPYRRSDGTLEGDDPRYVWWAEHGFAGVRVDIRGSGDSDGLLYDEYLPQEQHDAVEVIAWIARQPWSNGRVGMIGYSWGGFAGLQVAARRPSELGAVVTVNSTVRRYTDDCHYIGGCVNAHDMLSWATTMLAYDARPPDPAVVGEGWRAAWARRLDVAPPMIEPWLTHQLEDEYWKHGSVAFDYAQRDLPRPGRRRLGRSLPQRGARSRREPVRPALRADRPVGARLSARHRPRPADRIPGRVRALLRPLPARRRERLRRRAAPARVHPGLRQAGALPRAAQRALDSACGNGPRRRCTASRSAIGRSRPSRPASSH